MQIGLDTAIITGLFSMITALISVAVTLYLGKKKASTDVQSIINAAITQISGGFTGLIEALRTQIEAQNNQIKGLEIKIDGLTITIHNLEDFILENKLVPPTFKLNRDGGTVKTNKPN